MKKLSFWASIGALIISMAGLFFTYSAANELAYVDINVLFKEYHRSTMLQKEFEKKVENIKSNVDSLQMGWQNELMAFEKERNSLSKKELELKKQLLGSKQQQINNFQQASELKMQKEEQNMTQTIINDINDLVKEYGKKNGYNIIYGATGSGNIMYAEDALNITDEVLLDLNTQFNKE